MWIITSPNKPAHQADHLHHQHHYQQSASIGLSSVGIISFAQTIRFGKEILVSRQKSTCIQLFFIVINTILITSNIRGTKKGLAGFSHFQLIQLNHQLFTFTFFSPKFLLVPIQKSKINETKSQTWH